MSIMEIAEAVTAAVPAEIVVSESNDARSYRLNSDKLLGTGFAPRFSVSDGIRDVIDAFKAGKFKNEDACYNIKAIKAGGVGQ
jgi:nucleoside-diphosphate-sugar epimerase